MEKLRLTQTLLGLTGNLLPDFSRQQKSWQVTWIVVASKLERDLNCILNEPWESLTLMVKLMHGVVQ
jgi:hypothetical protein